MMASGAFTGAGGAGDQLVVGLLRLLGLLVLLLVGLGSLVVALGLLVGLRRLVLGLQLADDIIEVALAVPAVGFAGLGNALVAQLNSDGGFLDVELLGQVAHAVLEFRGLLLDFLLGSLALGVSLGSLFVLLVLCHDT